MGTNSGSSDVAPTQGREHEMAIYDSLHPRLRAAVGRVAYTYILAEIVEVIDEEQLTVAEAETLILRTSGQDAMHEYMGMGVRGDALTELVKAYQREVGLRR